MYTQTLRVNESRLHPSINGYTNQFIDGENGSFIHLILTGPNHTQEIGGLLERISTLYQSPTTMSANVID